MVVLEASAPKRDALPSITENRPNIFEFHEFTTTTCWIMQLLLNIVMSTKIYQRIAIQECVMSLMVRTHRGRGSLIFQDAVLSPMHGLPKTDGDFMTGFIW